MPRLMLAKVLLENITVTMEQAGLLSLPVEVLHNISQYLAVKDILNCSETCHYLRLAFNYNSVWRRLVPENALELEAQEQILEPAIQWEDTLSPLCDYRVHYMRMTHLLNNWNTENFVKYSTETPHSFVFGGLDDTKGRGQVFFKDRYLFLGLLENHRETVRIEIWDVGKEPVLHSFVHIENTNYGCFYIIGSNLVVVKCHKVSVYQINIPDNHHPLLYSFIFMETEAVWNEDVHHESCNVRWEISNVGHYLVYSQFRYGFQSKNNVIHVWDIVNAEKVGAFIIPVNDLLGIVELVAHNEDEWLLRVGTVDVADFYLFNIKTKTFSNTYFKTQGDEVSITLYKSHILYMFERLNGIMCLVYDLNSSKETKRRRFPRLKNYLYFPFPIFNSSFVVPCIDGCQIVDALSLDTINHVQYDTTVDPITNHFTVYSSSFLVTLMEINFKLLIRNITKKDKINKPLELDNSSFLFLNDNMTKLVTVNNNHKLNVFHFW